MVSKAQKAESTPTDKDIVDAGINRMVEALGIDVQKARYKAMRAIAWQAFIEYIDEGIFDDLVERAITNAPDLPSGWELARPVAKKAAKPAAKKSSKKTTKKAPKAPEPQLEDFEDEDVTDVVSEGLDIVQVQDAPEALPEQTVFSLTEDELEAPATPDSDSTAVKNATRTQRRRRIRRTR